MILYHLISTATFSSLFFLAILTLSKKNSSLNGYRFLAAFFIFISLTFADEASGYTGLYTIYPWLTIVSQPTLYAIAPAFYLAVVYLTSINKKLSFIIALHFIPYFIITGLFVLIYFLTYSSRFSLPDTTGNTKQIDLIFLLFLFVQIFIYLYLSARQIKKHKKTLPLFASSLAGNDYKWLDNVIIGLNILTLIWLAESLIDKIQISYYFSFIYLIGVYYIGVQVIRQKDIFPFSKEQNESVTALINESDGKDLETPFLNKNGEPDTSVTEIKPARKQVLNDEKLEQYKEQLLTLMETDRPYLDSDLTLPKLAKMLPLNTYQTSYIINACFSENFYTFVNRYRVQECKRMLEGSMYNHLSILGIGFEAGFNSKTAFNTTFKKLTGSSPGEYKEQLAKTYNKTGSPPSNNL